MVQSLAPLRWRCGQSSLYYCIQCSRFAGDVASHLFIIVFNVPASLAMWPVISLLLYSMFPLRWRCGQSSLYYCIQCSRFAGDVASHLFIIVFNVPASLAMWPVISLLLYSMFPLRWRCGQSSLYYCIQCSRFAGDVASHLFIIVFNVPASLAMWPVISLLLYSMFPLRWRCGQSSLYYCIQCSRFAGDVGSHLFIIVFNVPASLAMWPVISLLLYLMFPLRWRCGQSSLYYCI